MALPILDGNQSPTTLSTIIVSNAHVPAHTVTSLGTQAITDIATAVSGVELGPNTINALENITVTLGQVTITGGLTDTQLRASPVTIGGNVTATISGTPSITFGTAVITGSTSVLNFPATQTVTFSQASVTFGTAVVTGATSIIGTPSVTFSTASVTFGTAVVTGSASIIGTASVTFGTAVITGSTSILNFPATQPVSIASLPALAAGTNQIGSVTVGNSITIGSLPAIAGAVTISNIGSQARVDLLNVITAATVAIGVKSQLVSSTAQIGSVTASVSNFPAQFNDPAAGDIVRIALHQQDGEWYPVGVDNALNVSVSNTPSVTFGAISGTVTANGGNFTGAQAQAQPPERAIQLGYYDSANSEFVVINESGIPIQTINPLTIQGSDDGKVPISGTVTANLPRPTWTDYSGTITTAGTAVTAVGTITRSYLLAQVTTGQMFLNIGETATTSNSVYFSAGQGFAWETTVPQGIVSIISTVAGTRYVLKEG